MSAITERVAAGAAFLDEHDPEWWRAEVERAIILERLDLAEGDMCVLGQRCPLEVLAAFMAVPVGNLLPVDFSEGYDAYLCHLSGMRDAERVDWACDRGFALLPDAHSPEALAAMPGKWDELTTEWKRVITERRSAS